MNTHSLSLTVMQRRGRTFFLSALGLLGSILFRPLITSYFSGEQDMGETLFTTALYVLVLVAAFRGGILSLRILKGILGIFVVIFVAAMSIVSVSVYLGRMPSPRVGWDWQSLIDLLSLVPLIFIFWALFFSKAVQDFIAFQRNERHLRELKKYQRK